MQNQNWRRVIVVAIAAVFVVSFITAAQALPLAGPNRPAVVPAHYVITPFGYFDPSCVKHLAKGDVLRKDEKTIEHANGTRDNTPVCAFAHYTADGEKIIGDERAVQPPRSAMLGLNMRASLRLPPMAKSIRNGKSPGAQQQRRPDRVPLQWPGGLQGCGDDHSARLGVELRLHQCVGHRQLELLRERHRL